MEVERKAERTTRFFLKNDGIQYRAPVRRRGSAVSRTYKEGYLRPLFSLLSFRGDCVYAAVASVCARMAVRKRIRKEEGNVSGRGRSVPADRSIGRDFKADCPYKVKNFSRSSKSVSVRMYLRERERIRRDVRPGTCGPVPILATVTRRAVKVSPFLYLSRWSTHGPSSASPPDVIKFSESSRSAAGEYRAHDNGFATSCGARG